MVLATSARAQFDYGFEFTKAGTAGLQFLKIGVGAREAALGEAASGLSTGPNSVFWNVGALALDNRPLLSFSHTRWLNDSRVMAAVVTYGFEPYVVGVSVYSFSIAEFEETTVQAPTGTGRMVSAGDFLAGLAVGRRFTEQLSIGVQIKFVQETLDQDRFRNVLFDVGTVYYTGFHHLRLAFTMQHFGPDMTLLQEKFRTPLLFRVSAADDLLKDDSHRFTAALDLVHPTDNVEWLHFGAEYSFLGALALRGGYRFGHDEGRVAFGAGVSTGDLTPLELTVDYAYVRFGDVLGATHRISLTAGL
jgi:hypothetical protein